VALQKYSVDRSEVGQIVKECKLKKPPDRQVILDKIGRDCNNVVAHELYQLGLAELSGGVSQSAAPTCCVESGFERL
jgi:hypothetical protein